MRHTHKEPTRGEIEAACFYNAHVLTLFENRKQQTNVPEDTTSAPSTAITDAVLAILAQPLSPKPAPATTQTARGLHHQAHYPSIDITAPLILVRPHHMAQTQYTGLLATSLLLVIDHEHITASSHRDGLYTIMGEHQLQLLANFGLWTRSPQQVDVGIMLPRQSDHTTSKSSNRRRARG